MDCSTPGFPVHHQLPELSQTHVHQVSDAVQPSHPLSSPSSPAFSLTQHQGLFKWVHSSFKVAKVLEFQLQHQSFQWTFRTDFLIGSPCCPRDSQESSPTPQFKSIKEEPYKTRRRLGPSPVCWGPGPSHSSSLRRKGEKWREVLKCNPLVAHLPKI